jgi:hypothetical protein
VSKFCEEFPWIRFDDALIEAVRLADQAAKRFNPDLGYDFSTFLLPHLKKLYAMQEGEKGWGHAKPTDWHQDQEASPAPIYPTGANGTRVALDRWKLGDDTRKGVVIAMTLRENTEGHSVGFVERVSAALTVLRDDAGPGADGRLRATIDHWSACSVSKMRKPKIAGMGFIPRRFWRRGGHPFTYSVTKPGRRGIPAYSQTSTTVANDGPTTGSKSLARSFTPSPAAPALGREGFPARRLIAPNATLNSPARP